MTDVRSEVLAANRAYSATFGARSELALPPARRWIAPAAARPLVTGTYTADSIASYCLRVVNRRCPWSRIGGSCTSETGYVVAGGTTIGPAGGWVNRIGLPNGSRRLQSVP